ncbi:class C beta-lactamase-related serine hydrolase [Henriciella mobilis]|uniref:serine hydrolase domain-containing protein n=1 Tax=Henriciella mobilis TaxID=2305467 RepID=UPI000E66936E|nr:serine hydrolase [Henriciella mobilis]RIJ17544.1 class C beta-lactamase-related serine hydrolase [Henriciella mobilis]RIJ25468.1 class C beta-lactamase-related serine hydrolase [Henriciella mobilis]
MLGKGYGRFWLGQKRLLASLALAFATILPATAQSLVPLPPQPDGLAWPTEGWEQGELPPGIADDVRAQIDEAMARELSDVMGETRGVVIIHRGKLVLEAYRDGFGPDTKQVSWSMAKSITSALTGRAVQLGLIEDIDAPMPSPFEADDPRSEITWRQWLTMTDGLDYLEIGATSMAENDVIQMMYGPGRFDVTQYIVSELPLIHEPGTVWNYSTAGYHLLGRALQKTISDKTNCSHPKLDLCSEAGSGPSWSAQVIKALLFDPLGMDAQPEFDSAGTYLGGSLVWASARDFAKFGYLYLRDGVWEGERLLPEGWVDFSRTDPDATDANVYGAGWWITTRGADPVPSYQKRNAPPWDSFAAEGHEGQTIFVVPSRDLVIVRLGLMSNEGENWPELFRWNQSLAARFPETRFASIPDESGTETNSL